jgi:hypothetical protein
MKDCESVNSVHKEQLLLDEMLILLLGNNDVSIYDLKIYIHVHTHTYLLLLMKFLS